MLVGIHIGEDGFQERRIDEILLRHTFQIPEALEISDAVGFRVMPENTDRTGLLSEVDRLQRLLVPDLYGVLTDILSLQEGQLPDQFRILLFVLPRRQFFRLPHEVPDLIRGKRSFEIRHFLPVSFLPLLLKALFRAQDHTGAVAVPEDLLPDQLFKIAASDKAPQLGKCIQLAQAVKRTRLIVEPGIQHVDAVHQALRISSVVRLPELEFQIIETCKKRVRIDALFGLVFQRIQNDGQEPVRVRLLRVFRDDGEIRLADPVGIGAVNVLSDPGVEKRLAHRRAGLAADRHGGLEEFAVPAVSAGGTVAESLDHLPGN